MSKISNNFTFILFSLVSHIDNRSRVMHICVSNFTIIGAEDKLSHFQCQTSTWTNIGLLSMTHPWQNISANWIKIQAGLFIYNMGINQTMTNTHSKPFHVGIDTQVGVIVTSPMTCESHCMLRQSRWVVWFKRHRPSPNRGINSCWIII